MLAILTALPPTTPPRQLRLLLAIETFPADAGGWRPVGTELLMEAANVSYPTFKAARQEVLAAGWAAYEPGGGAAKLSRWRLLVDLKTWEDRVTTLEGRKGGNPPPAERDRSRVTDRTARGDGPGPRQPANSAKAPKSRPASKRTGKRGTPTPTPPPSSEVLRHRAWCRDCGFELDRALADAGVQVHPGCVDPAAGAAAPSTSTTARRSS